MILVHLTIVASSLLGAEITVQASRGERAHSAYHRSLSGFDRPSERTVETLKRFDLVTRYRRDPEGALANLELDLLAFVQGLVPLACDLRVMDEDVLRLSVGRDEAVALRVVEPLDGAGSHVEDTLPLILNGKEAPNWLRRLLVLFVAVRVAPEACGFALRQLRFGNQGTKIDVSCW